MDLRAGDKLGRFKVEAMVGGGGMGKVYAAIDGSSGERVAIKVPRLSELDDACRRKWSIRFAREASALRRLQHPAIVQLREVDLHTAPLPFFVMEYIEGKTATQWARDEAGTLSDWLRIGREVAEALAFAHAEDVLHRDIKAENILVWREGGRLRVKVIDWGILSDARETIVLTQTGEALGTPGAMDPSVLQGESGYSAQTDLYALGAFLFHGIFRRSHLVTGGDKIEANRANVVVKPTDLQRDFDLNVEKLLLELLDENPARRPKSARRVAQKLSILANAHDAGPLVAPEQKAWPRSPPWYRSKRKSFSVQLLGPLGIFAISAQEQDDDMFNEYLASLEEHDQANTLPTHMLVYSPTRSPSARHRAMQKSHPTSQRAMAKCKKQVVLTDSSIVRGAVTAYTWIFVNDAKVKAYRPGQYREGFQWLSEDLPFPIGDAIEILNDLVVFVGYPPLT